MSRDSGFHGHRYIDIGVQFNFIHCHFIGLLICVGKSYQGGKCWTRMEFACQTAVSEDGVG